MRCLVSKALTPVGPSRFESKGVVEERGRELTTEGHSKPPAAQRAGGISCCGSPIVVWAQRNRACSASPSACCSAYLYWGALQPHGVPEGPRRGLASRRKMGRAPPRGILKADWGVGPEACAFRHPHSTTARPLEPALALGGSNSGLATHAHTHLLC